VISAQTSAEVRRIYEEAVRLEKARDAQRRSEPQYVYLSIRSLVVSTILLVMATVLGTIEIQKLSFQPPPEVTETPVDVVRSGVPIEQLKREGIQVIATTSSRERKTGKTPVRINRTQPGPI